MHALKAKGADKKEAKSGGKKRGQYHAIYLLVILLSTCSSCLANNFWNLDKDHDNNLGNVIVDLILNKK